MDVDHSVPASDLTFSQVDIVDQFAAGHCAMMVNGPWGIGTLAKSQVKYGVTQWPHDVTSGTWLGGEIAVAGNGPHVGDAWNFIKWLSDPSHITESEILGLSLLPNRLDTESQPKWLPAPADRYKVFAAQLAVARSRAVYGAQFGQVADAVRQALQQVLSGQASPAVAARQAASTIHPLLPASMGGAGS
jgi:multiple sugar transport system substrate-binding protein